MWIHVGAHDAIPIYLYLLTYLPTHLIIPSGPLEAISDLHTVRRDGFTRSPVCTMPAVLYFTVTLHRVPSGPAFAPFSSYSGNRGQRIRARADTYYTPRIPRIVYVASSIFSRGLVPTTNN